MSGTCSSGKSAVLQGVHKTSLCCSPHINFVSGTNGSGKSAVLQGIQQALGVRASATNRASTQKEFIRKGAHEALISVTLWNKGEDAYQPEKFGSFITVERRIGQSCSWAIRDAK